VQAQKLICAARAASFHWLRCWLAFTSGHPLSHVPMPAGTEIGGGYLCGTLLQPQVQHGDNRSSVTNAASSECTSSISWSKWAEPWTWESCRRPAPLVPRRWAPRCASCCRTAARSPALTPAAAHQVALSHNPCSPAHCQAGATCQACQRYHLGRHSTPAAGMAALPRPIAVAMHASFASQRAPPLVEV
jgi:hypothetical protein